jgi:hypothetical protein
MQANEAKKQGVKGTGLVTGAKSPSIDAKRLWSACGLPQLSFSGARAGILPAAAGRGLTAFGGRLPPILAIHDALVNLDSADSLDHLYSLIRIGKQ